MADQLTRRESLKRGLVAAGVLALPHYSPGTIHAEPAEKYGIPFEATQGGAETTYPEYQLTIQQMRAQNQGGAPKR